MSEVAAHASGRPAASLRLPLQSLVFLVARYAAQDPTELAEVAGLPAGDPGAVVAAVEAHLIDLARAALALPAPSASPRKPRKASSRTSVRASRPLPPLLAAPRPAAPAPEGLPPLDTRFTLGPSITDEQSAFLHEHGFLVFGGVVRPAEIATVVAELDRIEARWIAEERQAVYGVPLFLGGENEGRPFVQRLPFTSVFSPPIHALVRDERFAPIRTLVGDGARVGDREKDGVVVNRYLNVPGSVHPRLGWHTDGLRDLFYLRMPRPMLNVGLHFDRCPRASGGLRLIPGSHRQGFLSMCFRKPYFVSHAPDPHEVAIETEPGDLTVHDGRLWHRVARSSSAGAASLRRTMYVPYLTDPYEPKGESRPDSPLSPTRGAPAAAAIAVGATSTSGAGPRSSRAATRCAGGRPRSSCRRTRRSWARAEAFRGPARSAGGRTRSSRRGARSPRPKNAILSRRSALRRRKNAVLSQRSALSPAEEARSSRERERWFFRRRSALVHERPRLLPRSGVFFCKQNAVCRLRIVSLHERNAALRRK